MPKSRILLTFLLLCVAALMSWPFFASIYELKKSLIFGDDGDGLFNLWTMRYNLITWTRGLWESWLDANMFYPSTAPTLLWSETLILPSVFYQIALVLIDHPLTAYNGTVLGLSFLYFCAIYSVLSALYPSESRNAGDFLLLLSAAIGCWYLSGRTIYYVHFQNLSSFWLLFLATGCIRYLKEPSAKWLWLALFSFWAVNHSAQYFAVASVPIVVAFAWIYCFRTPEPLTNLGFFLKKHWRSLGLCLAATLPIVACYGLLVESKGTGPISQVSFRDWHSPMGNTNIHDLLKGWGVKLRRVDHETPAYLGIVWLGLLLILISTTAKLWMPVLRALPWKRLFAWGLCAVIANQFHKAWIDAQAWILLGVLLAVAYEVLSQLLTAVRRGQMSPHVAFTIIAALCLYGLSFGRNDWSRGAVVNPSYWQVFAALIPGVDSMRAIGRLVTIGHLLFIPLILRWLMLFAQSREWRVQPMWWKLGLSLFFLLAAVEHYQKPYLSKMSWTGLRFTKGQQNFLQNIEEPILVFPARPFHLNTYNLNRFVETPQISLMNGYSGRSTPLFDKIMASKGREPTDEQMEIAQQNGVRLFMIDKRRRKTKPVTEVNGAKILYEDKEVVVFRR